MDEGQSEETKIGEGQFAERQAKMREYIDAFNKHSQTEGFNTHDFAANLLIEVYGCQFYDVPQYFLLDQGELSALIQQHIKFVRMQEDIINFVHNGYKYLSYRPFSYDFSVFSLDEVEGSSDKFNSWQQRLEAELLENGAPTEMLSAVHTLFDHNAFRSNLGTAMALGAEFVLKHGIPELRHFLKDESILDGIKQVYLLKDEFSASYSNKVDSEKLEVVYKSKKSVASVLNKMGEYWGKLDEC